MLEILQYVTSSFWVFFGSLSFVMACGWAINAALVGIRGIPVDNPFDD